jgi:hypothetical protein
MAKSKSTVRKAKAPSEDEQLIYARAKAMALRVESQRDRLFGVIGIIGCAREAIGDELEPGEPDIQAALDLAVQILDDMSGNLDPVHFRVQFEVAHG